MCALSRAPNAWRTKIELLNEISATTRVKRARAHPSDCTLSQIGTVAAMLREWDRSTCTCADGCYAHGSIVMRLKSIIKLVRVQTEKRSASLNSDINVWLPQLDTSKVGVHVCVCVSADLC